MNVTKVILVGHCTADAEALTHVVRQAAAQVPIEAVNRDTELDKLAMHDSLLLINRVLDGRFNASYGMALIKSLAKKSRPPVMMLISNYPEAQAKAIIAGAKQGFGKSDVFDEKTAELVRQAMGVADRVLERGKGQSPERHEVKPQRRYGP